MKNIGPVLDNDLQTSKEPMVKNFWHTFQTILRLNFFYKETFLFRKDFRIFFAHDFFSTFFMKFFKNSKIFLSILFKWFYDEKNC